MLAKLDNLGPFQFFFTLSCADMRWEENFSAILRKLGHTIEYTVDSNQKEETWVMDGNNQKLRLKDFSENHVDESLHELIRRHVFIATQNYQHRVKAFITNILQDKNNPMHVEYWTTKVEFQGRGAGHNHGTIWVDMKKMELSFLDNDKKWSDIDQLLKTRCRNDVNTKSDLIRLLRTYYCKDSVYHHTDITLLQNIYAEIFQTDDGTAVCNMEPH